MTTTTPEDLRTTPERPGIWRFLSALEVDTRLLGMVVALAVIWIGFHLLTGGTFLTARNLWNLSVQTSVVGVMATGMVFVIVTRNIDLSVGALLATCSAMMAVTQTIVAPGWLGIELGSGLIAPLAIVAGLITGAVIGAFHGLPRARTKGTLKPRPGALAPPSSRAAAACGP